MTSHDVRGGGMAERGWGISPFVESLQSAGRPGRVPNGPDLPSPHGTAPTRLDPERMHCMQVSSRLFYGAQVLFCPPATIGA